MVLSMNRTPHFLNNIAIQAGLIIVGLSVASLVLSVYLYRESMREIALKEVENKATIFLSAMETSVRRLAMERSTKSMVDLIQERAELIRENLNFAIVAVMLREPDGTIIEHKRRNPDGTVSEPVRKLGPDSSYIPEDFQTVIDTGQPLVKREVRTLQMTEGQPEIRVIEAFYPISKPNKGELLAVIKIVISVERTFEMVRVEYQNFTRNVILGFAFSTFLLILGILLFIRQRIISPLLSLHDGADRVASGDLRTYIKPKGSNEVSELMRSFNKMVDGLRQRDQMQRSLEVAKEVQQKLLPQTMPTVEGLDIAGTSVYCDETGGDYYDFIEFEQNNQDRIDVVIGDVSGHGVSSALLMTTARAFLRQRAALPGTTAEIISDVNRQLSRDVADTGSFMTMLYMTIDKPGKCLHWVRAGHDPAIFYDPESDVISELKGPGIALGVDGDFSFTENHLEDLRDGQIILLGTDGIWEARNPSGAMFGKDAVYSIIRENAHLDAAAIIGRLIDDLTDFQGGGTVEDDITLIVVKTTPAL